MINNYYYDKFSKCLKELHLKRRKNKKRNFKIKNQKRR